MPFRDLREFITALEQQGQLCRVTRQVDWNLELAHVAKLNEERGGAALLFQDIKDYPGKYVFSGAFTARERMAIALGLDPHTRYVELARHWVQRTQERVPPVMVEQGEWQQNVRQGAEVNLLELPVPWVYPADGGRYIGTAVYLITRNPDTGRVNLGTYRGMVIDQRTIGIQIIKGKDADIDLKAYARAKQPMPCAYVIGGNPLLFACSSTLFPLDFSEYDAAGSLNGAPIEVARGLTTDLPIPAGAEIVIEGEIMPGETLPEGPFGEYTGYYSGAGEHTREFITVKSLAFRDEPILWLSTVGKPTTDTHMIMGINHNATLWSDLLRAKIPGIQAVYCPPEAAGRMLAVISIRQMYYGHSTWVGLAAFSSITGNYGLKTVIVVDEDIDPEDWSQVLYALAFRLQPERGIQVLHRGRSTPLDPSLPVDSRYLTSRVLIDCCIPYEWEKKPRPIELDQELVKRITDEWDTYFGQLPAHGHEARARERPLAVPAPSARR